MQGRMPIFVSLAVGLLAVILVNFYIGSVRQELEPAKTRVMIAVRDLRPGTILEAKDVAPALRVTDSLPKLAVKWDERTLYLGQDVGFQVSEGDYILASYFGSQAAAAQRLSEKIDARLNQRAMTIPVTTENSLEGSIRPGDRIDILLTYRTARESAAAVKGGADVTGTQLVTAPLLENVYVLLTGKYGTAARADYSTITVLASSDEAKLLIWAMKLGEFSMLLRNPKDLQATDRGFLAGGVGSLDALGHQPLKVGDLISQRRAPVE